MGGDIHDCPIKRLTFLPFNIELTLTFERLKELHRFFGCPITGMNLSVFIPFGHNEVSV